MFKFKQFSVQHSMSGIKIGTDAILLGAWTNVENATSILDIGTGCGVIALMLAQRSSACIAAIDILEEATTESQLNFENSPWNDRLSSSNISFQSFAKMTDKQFDIIVSNPPFFSNSLKTNLLKKTIAKHDTSLSFGDICLGAKRVLKNNGSLNVILPFSELRRFTNESLMHGFYVCRQTDVITIENQLPKRVLLELRLQPVIKQKTILTLQHWNSSKTQEYIKLTGDFYL